LKRVNRLKALKVDTQYQNTIADITFYHKVVQSKYNKLNSYLQLPNIVFFHPLLAVFQAENTAL